MSLSCEEERMLVLGELSSTEWKKGFEILVAVEEKHKVSLAGKSAFRLAELVRSGFAEERKIVDKECTILGYTPEYRRTQSGLKHLLEAGQKGSVGLAPGMLPA